MIKMSLAGLLLLPASLLSLLVAADTGVFTNSSTATTSSTLACDGCTITALEMFHTYPSAVDVTSITATQTVTPVVTVYANGSSETNYLTETAANATANAPSPEPTDPFASLTWIVDNVTLTYPTTYVQFFGLSGGVFISVRNEATCTFEDDPLDLPTDSASHLFAPVTQSVDLASPTAVPVPSSVNAYLNGIPAVSTQFHGTDVASCSWTKIPGSRTRAFETGTTTPEATINKISVSVLTQVTASQVVLTAPDHSNTPAIAHIESGGGSSLDVPSGSTPTGSGSSGNSGGQGTTGGSSNSGQGSTGGNSNNGQGSTGGNSNNGQGSGGSGSSSGSNSNSGQGAAAQGQQQGGSGGSTQPSTGNTQSGGQGGQANNQGSGGSGSGSSQTSNLVLTLGGTKTTVAPSVVPKGSGTGGSGGSATVFILGPGTTLTAGGSAITISGQVISAPAAAATTTTGGTGGAVASGLGYTGQLTTGQASNMRGPEVALWVLAASGGLVGGLAVGL